MIILDTKLTIFPSSVVKRMPINIINAIPAIVPNEVMKFLPSE